MKAIEVKTIEMITCPSCGGRKETEIYVCGSGPRVQPCRPCEGTGEITTDQLIRILLGQYMRKNRVEYRNVSQREEAKRLGVDFLEWHGIECGRNPLTPEGWAALRQRVIELFGHPEPIQLGAPGEVQWSAAPDDERVAIEKFIGERLAARAIWPRGSEIKEWPTPMIEQKGDLVGPTFYTPGARVSDEAIKLAAEIEAGWEGNRSMIEEIRAAMERAEATRDAIDRAEAAIASSNKADAPAGDAPAAGDLGEGIVPAAWDAQMANDRIEQLIMLRGMDKGDAPAGDQAADEKGGEKTW